MTTGPTPSTVEGIVIRPATAADIEATTNIINHYIAHSTANFAEQPIPLSANLSAFETNHLALGFPYLVAEQDGQILGYAKLSPFRTGTGGGYRISAELSLFLHPEKRGQKIGARLLNKLLDVVAHPDQYDTTYIGLARRGEDRIRNVLSTMGADPAAPGGGEPLARFYESFGFERVGRLRGIAIKFGRT
jgi:GNAT superfamily N-acetyltransferase